MSMVRSSCWMQGRQQGHRIWIVARGIGGFQALYAIVFLRSYRVRHRARRGSSLCFRFEHEEAVAVREGGTYLGHGGGNRSMTLRILRTDRKRTRKQHANKNLQQMNNNAL